VKESGRRHHFVKLLISPNFSNSESAENCHAGGHIVVMGNSTGMSIWAGPKRSEFQIVMWAELNAQKEWYLKNRVFIDQGIKMMTETWFSFHSTLGLDELRLE
jgi:hypothetical protein